MRAVVMSGVAWFVVACGSAEVESVCPSDSQGPCPESCESVEGQHLLDNGCVALEHIACDVRGQVAAASTGCVVRVRDGAMFWVGSQNSVLYNSHEWRACTSEEETSVAHVDSMLESGQTCP